MSMLWALMMTVALSGSLSDAVQCYYCAYFGDPEETAEKSTCSDPFSPQGVATCEGDLCVSAVLNYIDPFTGAGPYYNILRGCVNVSDLPETPNMDNCKANDALFNQSFFENKGLCCYNFTEPKLLLNYTECYCIKELCNQFLYTPSHRHHHIPHRPFHRPPSGRSPHPRRPFQRLPPPSTTRHHDRPT